MDNCARENKNKYVLGYFSYLIKQNLFSNIYINYLQVGHTHIDVDALFSLISKQMKKTNVFTIDQLHQAIRDGVKSTINVTHVDNIPHITKYMKEKKYLNNIVGFTNSKLLFDK